MSTATRERKRRKEKKTVKEKKRERGTEGDGERRGKRESARTPGNNNANLSKHVGGETRLITADLR